MMEKTLEKADQLRQELGEIEMNVLTNFTLADAIREGSSITTQAQGWGDGENACALHAAVISAKARGYM